jgi:hypothetical protein
VDDSLLTPRLAQPHQTRSFASLEVAMATHQQHLHAVAGRILDGGTLERLRRRKKCEAVYFVGLSMAFVGSTPFILHNAVDGWTRFPPTSGFMRRLRRHI